MTSSAPSERTKSWLLRRVVVMTRAPMRTAFIDRRKRPFGETPHQADLLVENFAELARSLC